MKLQTILTEANWNADQVEKWLKKMGVKNYTINADMSVGVNGNVSLFEKGLDNLPIQFDFVTGDFSARHNKLTTLRGFPRAVGGDLSFSHNPRLKSFKGLSNCHVGGTVYMKDTGIKSLEGVSDAFFSITSSYAGIDLESIRSEIKAGGIGVLLIKNFVVQSNMSEWSDCGKAFTIIKKYIGRPDDIYECQNELLDAKLEAFSRL